jgi:hypothetical protein
MDKEKFIQVLGSSRTWQEVADKCVDEVTVSRRKFDRLFTGQCHPLHLSVKPLRISRKDGKMVSRQCKHYRMTNLARAIQREVLCCKAMNKPIHHSALVNFLAESSLTDDGRPFSDACLLASMQSFMQRI